MGLGLTNVESLYSWQTKLYVISYDTFGRNKCQKNVLLLLQGDWHEAMKFCSKLGMSALTVYNLEKQGCLFDVLGIKYPNFRTNNSHKFAENRADGGRQCYVDGGKGKFLWHQIRMVFPEAILPCKSWSGVEAAEKCLLEWQVRDHWIRSCC